MRIFIRFIALLFSLTSLYATSETKVCSTLNECKNAIIEQGLKREADKYGMSRVDSSIAKATRSLDSDVTEMLVQLLKHRSFGVRRLAGYTLQGVNQIDPKYLTDIKGAIDTTPWLVRALGRVSSPEAAYEAVKRYSVSSSAPHNGEAYAVKLSRERAVPFIMDFIRCKADCPENYVYNFGVLISELEVEKSSLVQALKEVISDASITDQAIMGAIDILAFMENDALSAEPFLTRLLEEKPELEQTLNRAFIRIGTDRGIELLIDAIEKEPTPYMVFELAKYGHRAKSAAPVLLELLKLESFELKRVIVRTLGLLGNLIAEEHLISMLNNDNDVVISIFAAQSLAVLKSKKALAPLALIQDSHWYPPVRMAAKDAIEMINEHASVPENMSNIRSYYSLTQSEYLTQNICNNVPLTKLEELNSVKLYQTNHLDDLKRLSYDTHVLSYGASDETNQILSGKEVIEVTPENIIEHKTSLEQVPDLALRVDGGWLVGSNRGEWGGELVFIGDDGAKVRVLSANIEDIYQLGDEIIATTGLAHLGSNSGMIFKLFYDKNSGWTAQEWIKLPGSPQSSWFVETRELLINVLRGGSILLSKDGTMRIAPCNEI